MAVIFKCNHCGKDISDSVNFDGCAVDFAKYMEDKTKELSEKCECRKDKRLYVRLRGSCTCVGEIGYLEFFDKEYELRESLWIEWKNRFQSHDLESDDILYDIQNFLEEELEAGDIYDAYVWGDALFRRDWSYITEEDTENGIVDFCFRFTDKGESAFGEITVSDKPQKDCRNVFIFSALDLC